MQDRPTIDTNPAPPELDASVIDRLRAVAVRLRGFVLLDGTAQVVGFLLAACTAQAALDYAVRLRWNTRATLLALLAAAAGTLLWRRVIGPMRVPIGTDAVARLVERRHPRLASVLISAVRFSTGQIGPRASNSPELAASVVRRARRAAADIDFTTVLDHRPARRAGIALGAALVVCAVALAAAPDVVAVWFSRNVLLRDVAWPQRTQLIVDADGDALIGARGDDLEIRARARGVVPRGVEIIYETVSGRRGRDMMIAVGTDGFRHTIRNAREDFTFHLEGGDDRTPTFNVRLVDRPRIVRTQIHVAPPRYTHIEPYTLADGHRAAQVLPGTTVTIHIDTNQPITRATLMAGDDALTDATCAPHDDAPPLIGHRCTATVLPTETHTYHFALIDPVGMANKHPLRFSVRVVPDEPPRIRIVLPGVGDMVTRDAVLPIELELTDTFGLATAELVYDVRGRATPSDDTSDEPTDADRHEPTDDAARGGAIALPTFAPGATTFATHLSWPVAAASASAGHRITLLARAADFDDVSGPNVAQSPERMIRIVSRGELRAEFARREQEYRMDFERLVDRQERLRGRLLTLLDRLAQATGPTGTDDAGEPGRGHTATTGHALPPGDAAKLRGAMAPLERRQRTIASSVNVVRQQFAQLLTELHINRLDTPDVRARIRDRVVTPLTRLARRDLPAAGDALRRLARRPSPEQARRIDPHQADILTRMRAVLANMLQWEGYQEAVSMLQDIIALQKELKEETARRVQADAADVFDDGGGD